MKKLVLFLCLIAVCSPLLSCSATQSGGGEHSSEQSGNSTQAEDGTDGSENTGAPTQGIDRFADSIKTADSALDALPSTDLEGMSFIFTCTDTKKMFGEPAETVLSQTQYGRIDKLNDKLNTQIIQTQADTDSIKSGLLEAKNSGMVYSHLLSVSVSDIGALSYNGLIGNIQSLPFVDTSKPYYDADFCAEMRTSSGLYALYGDACLDTGSRMAVLYNDTLAQSIGITAMEQLVSEDGWTYDKMNEYAKAAAAVQVNESGVIGVLCSDTDKMLCSAYVSGKMESIVRTDSTLSLNDNRDKGDVLSSKLAELLAGGTYHAGGMGEVTADDIFRSGQALFYMTELGSIESIYNMNDVWGLLPQPNAEAGAEYCAPISKSTSVICYPDSSADLNEVGLMTECLFACSCDVLEAMTLDRYFHGYVRNEKTYLMLEMLIPNTESDFVLCYSDEFANFNEGTLDAFIRACRSENTYSRIYAANRASANRSLSFVR